MEWMVIRKIDAEPIEAWIGEESEMRRVFDRAGEQWTETYLVRVVAGPGNPASREMEAGRLEEAEALLLESTVALAFLADRPYCSHQADTLGELVGRLRDFLPDKPGSRLPKPETSTDTDESPRN